MSSTALGVVGRMAYLVRSNRQGCLVARFVTSERLPLELSISDNRASNRYENPRLCERSTVRRQEGRIPVATLSSVDFYDDTANA